MLPVLPKLNNNNKIITVIMGGWTKAAEERTEQTDGKDLKDRFAGRGEEGGWGGFSESGGGGRSQQHSVHAPGPTARSLPRGTALSLNPPLWAPKGVNQGSWQVEGPVGDRPAVMGDKSQGPGGTACSQQSIPGSG